MKTSEAVTFFSCHEWKGTVSAKINLQTCQSKMAMACVLQVNQKLLPNIANIFEFKNYAKKSTK